MKVFWFLASCVSTTAQQSFAPIDRNMGSDHISVLQRVGLQSTPAPTIAPIPSGSIPFGKCIFIRVELKDAKTYGYFSKFWLGTPVNGSKDPSHFSMGQCTQKHYQPRKCETKNKFFAWRGFNYNAGKHGYGDAPYKAGWGLDPQHAPSIDGTKLDTYKKDKLDKGVFKIIKGQWPNTISILNAAGDYLHGLSLQHMAFVKKGSTPWTNYQVRPIDNQDLIGGVPPVGGKPMFPSKKIKGLPLNKCVKMRWTKSDSYGGRGFWTIYFQAALDGSPDKVSMGICWNGYPSRMMMRWMKYNQHITYKRHPKGYFMSFWNWHVTYPKGTTADTEVPEKRWGKIDPKILSFKVKPAVDGKKDRYSLEAYTGQTVWGYLMDGPHSWVFAKTQEKIPEWNSFWLEECEAAPAPEPYWYVTRAPTPAPPTPVPTVEPTDAPTEVTVGKKCCCGGE